MLTIRQKIVGLDEHEVSLVNETVEIVERVCPIRFETEIGFYRKEKTGNFVNDIAASDGENVYLISSLMDIKWAYQPPRFTNSRYPGHGAMFHEIGHVITEQLDRYLRRMFVIAEAYKPYSDHVSQYAGKNLHEFLAESFVSKYFGDKDIVSMECWGIIERMFARQMKWADLESSLKESVERINKIA